MTQHDVILIMLGITVCYFVPTLVAFVRRKQNVVAIAALNILGGWTIVGYIVALVWALTEDAPRPKAVRP